MKNFLIGNPCSLRDVIFNIESRLGLFQRLISCRWEMKITAEKLLPNARDRQHTSTLEHPYILGHVCRMICTLILDSPDRTFIKVMSLKLFARIDLFFAVSVVNILVKLYKVCVFTATR